MCKLCKGDDGFRSDLVILETKFCFIMANLLPAGELSYLVIPNRHVSSIIETSLEESTDLMELIKSVSSRIEESLVHAQYNVFWNKGILAGQTIFHLHCHIVLKTQEDGVWIKRDNPFHEITSEEFIKMRNLLS